MFYFLPFSRPVAPPGVEFFTPMQPAQPKIKMNHPVSFETSAVRPISRVARRLREIFAHSRDLARSATVACLLGLALPGAFATVTTLNPTADTDTQSDVAAGTNPTINFSQWSTALFRFDLSSVSGTVSAATLRLYLPSGMSATTVTVASTSTDSWSEGGTKPSAGSVITTKAVGTLGAGYLEIDLTAYAQGKMTGTKVVSVAVTNTLGNWTSINSRQASSNQPQLVVTSGSTTTTSTLNPGADTDTQSDVAAGTNATINFSQWNTALFKFDLSSITGSVTASTLRLYLPGGISATTVTVATTSNDTWVEGGTKPSAGSTIATKAVGALGAGYLEVDLTAHTQTKMSGDKIVSVAVTDTLSGWTSINSRQSSSNKPQLVVTAGSGGTILVTGISISPTSASIPINGTVTLTATVTPSNATNRTVSWSSANSSVASVNSSGVVTGHVAGAANITAASTDGSNKTSNASVIAVTSGTVSRPSYNTGNGFFVLNGKLYDANGVEFVIRGVNKLHWDAASPGMLNSNANTVRWVIDFTQPTATNLGLMQQMINAHVVPIPGNWAGTCDSESALSAIVDEWVAQASSWTTLDRYMILNIANELGSSNSTAWRDAYITAVSRLRAAGYLCTIAIDAGGCGQDNDDLANFAAAVCNSDPQKNIIFDQHIYGNWGTNGNPSWATDLTAGLDRLKATGLCFVVGEFGPGRNIGPSPTMMTPGQIIAAADAHGFGWMAWAWDDPPSNADDTWFALSYNGNYNSSADLTIYGKDVVENSTYGLKARAVKQTHF